MDYDRMISLNPQYWEANQKLMYKFESIVGIVMINQLLGNARTFADLVWHSWVVQDHFVAVPSALKKRFY